MHFSFEPLFRKKIILEDVLLENLRYFSSRNELAKGIEGDNDDDQEKSLLDRVSSSLYGSIRNELNKDPFRFISQFSLGMGTRTLINGMENELQSTKAVKQLNAKIETLNQLIEKEDSFVPSPAYLSSLEKRVDNIRSYQRDVAQVSQAVSSSGTPCT